MGRWEALFCPLLAGLPKSRYLHLELEFHSHILRRFTLDVNESKSIEFSPRVDGAVTNGEPRINAVMGDGICCGERGPKK